jgi:hypothetical protein
VCGGWERGVCLLTSHDDLGSPPCALQCFGSRVGAIDSKLEKTAAPNSLANVLGWLTPSLDSETGSEPN